MDSNYVVCMANNCKDTNNISHICKKSKFVRNGENYKIHKIDWCEGGLQLADIATENVGDNNLNPRMKYIMVILDNWYRTLVK